VAWKDGKAWKDLEDYRSKAKPWVGRTGRLGRLGRIEGWEGFEGFDG
jgi:hypothetical protein